MKFVTHIVEVSRCLLTFPVQRSRCTGNINHYIHIYKYVTVKKVADTVNTEIHS